MIRRILATIMVGLGLMVFGIILGSIMWRT